MASQSALRDPATMDEFMASTAAAGHAAELSRLANNHAVFLDAMDDQLVFAPFLNTIPTDQKIVRILDSATADGLWLRALRSQLLSPSSTASETNATYDYSFTGTDINSALFHPSTPDMTFLQHSFHDPPPTPLLSAHDLVHQRLALGGSPPLPATSVIRGLLRCVKPGGWIQLVEMDLHARSEERGRVFDEFFELMGKLFGAAGVGDVFKAGGLEAALVEAGSGEGEDRVRVEDVHEQRFVMTIGKRGEGKEELGRKGVEGLAGAVEPLSAVARRMGCEGLGLDEGRLATLEGRMREELRGREGRYEMVVVWGRRALD